MKYLVALAALLLLSCSSPKDGPMSRLEELGESKQAVEYDYRLGSNSSGWEHDPCDAYVGSGGPCLVPRGLDTIRLHYAGWYGPYKTSATAATGWVSSELKTISSYSSPPSIPTNGIRIKVHTESFGPPLNDDVTFEPHLFVHVYCTSAEYAGMVDGWGALVYKCRDYGVAVDTGAIHAWASNNPNSQGTSTANTVFTAVAWGVAHALGVPTRPIHPSYANCAADLVYGPDVGACTFTSGQKCTVDSLYPNVGLYVHDNCG